LAVVDQFLVTSKSAYLRRCSQIQWAHRIAIITIIIWCLHGIPILLFFDVSLIDKACVNNNAGFAIYILVYLLGIIFAIPVSVMIIFGWLTYRNIRQTRVLAELQADRQLIRMTLTHVVLVVISLLPYGVYNTYSLITKSTIKDSDRQLKEYFANTIFSMVTYLYYVVG
jgi:formate hydrogenlyase subunit 3/multisubunit Na+/H+ antiporter MnhD subunit